MWGDVRAALFFCLLLAPQMLAPFRAEAEQIKLGVTLQLPITSHIGSNCRLVRTISVRPEPDRFLPRADHQHFKALRPFRVTERKRSALAWRRG